MRQLAGGCRPRPREGPPSLILTAPHAAPLSSLELSLSSARVLHATQRAVFTAMILLDGLDKHDEQPSPKLVAEASSSSVPVTRPLTPTPSLPPDYESSQAQLRPTTLSYPEIQEKRTRRRRCRRYTIFALAAYFFLTVVIGLPILVVVSTPHQFHLPIFTNPNPCAGSSETQEGQDACQVKSLLTLGRGQLVRSTAQYYHPW